MRIAKGLHAAVVGVSAGQAGSVEWTRTRETHTDSMTASAFIGHDSSICVRGSRQQRSGSSSCSSCRSLRRCRAGDSPFMSVAPVPEFIDHLAVDNLGTTTLRSGPRWTPEWKKPVETLEGADITIAQTVALKLDTETTLGKTGEKREAAAKTWGHYDLTRFSHLLSKEEEVELGRKVQQMLCWERVRSFLEVRLGRPPTLKEWAEEVTIWDGAQGLERELRKMMDARDRMISCNLRLVLHIARKSFFSGGSGGLKAGLDDMIQDGTAGLVRAVEKFDPEKGFRFSTYASWWVHQGIHTGLANAGRTIRLPMNMHSMVCRIARKRSELTDLFGRDPTASEIAIATGLPEAKVQYCVQANRVEPFSLDSKAWTKSATDDDISSTYRVEDTLGTTSNQEPVVGADQTLLRSHVEVMLGSLTEREASVLRMRFGIGGRSPSTFESIGRRLRLTRERVRQIESGALKKLRGAVPTDEVVLLSKGARYGLSDMEGWENKGFPSRRLLLELIENAFEQGTGEGDTKERKQGAETVRGRRKSKMVTDGGAAVDQPDPRREDSPTLQTA